MLGPMIEFVVMCVVGCGILGWPAAAATVGTFKIDGASDPVVGPRVLGGLLGFSAPGGK